MPAHKLPNGPQTYPWLQKLQWLIRTNEYLEECIQRYGDIFTLRIAPGSAPHVFISKPQAIQEIFVADSKQLDSGKEAGNNPFLQGQQSLVSLSGQRHLRQRKFLTPPFHGERIQAYGQMICELTEQTASTWTIGQPFSIYQSLQAISLEVSCKALFGSKNGFRYETLKKLLITILNPKRSRLRDIFFHFPFMRWDLGPWSTWGSLIRQKQQIDEIIYAEIQECREQPDPSRIDILSLMMAVRDELGEPMTDVELSDELITLLTQGPEITVTALVRAFYWILYNPQVLQKLLQELDSLGDDPDLKAIIRLPYLDAVYKETLRIYPPPQFAFPRLVKSPLQIMGYQFEPGTILSPCIHLTHHREDLYPQPKQFKPERFLEREFAPYEYLPFGGGNRRCIGAAFAQLEMKLVLATVLSRWQLALDDSKPVKPSRKDSLLPPVGSIQLVVKGRRSQNYLKPSQTPLDNSKVF